MEVHIPPLFVVLVAAVVAPMLGEYTSRFGLPVVVLELLLGVVIGPHGLGWASVTAGVPYFAVLGMGFLFFLAGLEIDLVATRSELGAAAAAWLLGFGLACAIALALRAHGLIHAWGAVAIAVATTALGILVPVLRDSRLIDTPLGRHIIAAGALGEMGPILAMSLALSRRHTAPIQTLFTAAFLLTVIAVGWALIQARTPAILGVLRRTMTQSSQLPIRVGVLLFASLALLADTFGLDLALGALAAGMLINLATRGSDVRVLHLKLDAIGFGLLVPIFFIASGMKLEIAVLFSGSGGFAMTAIFLGILLLIRIPAVLLHLRTLGARQSLALGLFAATTLSLVVALTEIAMKHGAMTAAEATPLIAASILTIIVFPAAGLKLAGKPARGPVVNAEREDL